MSSVYRKHKVLLVFLVGIVLFFTACGKEETRWDKAQQQSQTSPAAVSKDSVAGSSFNKFFPKASGDFDLTYAQEKTGFAQATLKKKKKEVALLSISDTVNNPDAAKKYKASKEVLAGFPVADIGNNATGVLVADRYQVQVRSSDTSFTKFDREDWIQKFDLDGLSRLK